MARGPRLCALLAAWANFKLYANVLLCASPTVLFGLDQGLIGASMFTMSPELRLASWQEGLVMGVAYISGALGGLFCGKLLDYSGRRFTVILAVLLFAGGALACCISTSADLLVLGRIVMGAGGGIAQVAAPILLAEISPAAHRGAIVSLGEVSEGLGVVWGAVIGWYYCEMDGGWRYMFGFGIVAPGCILLILLSLFVCESPRWLRVKGRSDEAVRILRRIAHPEAEMFEKLCKEPLPPDDEATWVELICTGSTKRSRVFYVCAGVAFWSQACGTEVVIYYSPELMELPTVKQSTLATIFLGLVQVLCTMIGCLCFDNIGRRACLLAGTVGIFLSHCATFLGYYLKNEVLNLVGVFGIIIAFSLSFAALTLVVCTESFPMRERAKGTALMQCLARLVMGLSLLVFVAFDGIPAWRGQIFAVLSCCTFTFIYLFLPETAGLSLENVAMVYDPDRAPIVYPRAARECLDPLLPCLRVRRAAKPAPAKVDESSGLMPRAGVSPQPD